MSISHGIVGGLIVGAVIIAFINQSKIYLHTVQLKFMIFIRPLNLVS